MEKNKIENILNMIGIETIVLCENHTDKCNCHSVVKEAA